MSCVSFHSPSREAELNGSEHLWLGSLVYDLAIGLLDLTGYDNAERLQELISPERRLIHGPGRLLSWAREFQTSFRVATGGEVLSYKGRPIEAFALALNTAVLIGNDQIKLAARLHAQCELHAYIEGPHRAWVANILEQGLDSGIYRKGLHIQPYPEAPREQWLWRPHGWEQVIELLRSRDDEPVVTSHSGTDGFPDEHTAVWEPPTDVDPTPGWAKEAPEEWAALSKDAREEYRRETASDHWYALPAEERWRLGMEGLRDSTGGLEITPDDWATFRFGHELTVLDLYADDWQERIEIALGIERQTT